MDLTSICSAIVVVIISYIVYNKYIKKYIIDTSQYAGKIVWITGASSGIGEALATLFCSLGSLVIISSRDSNKLLFLKNKLHEKYPSSPEPFVLDLDLSKINELKAKVNIVLDTFTTVDILINNAGISTRTSILDCNLEVYKELMDVNFYGPVMLTKLILPSMMKFDENQRHIVAINSVQGLFGVPFRSPYNSSKHALTGFCDSLISELYDHKHINVMVVYPGYVNTNLSKNARTGSGDLYNKMDKTTESGYSPDYVAQEILFGISEKRNSLLICDLKTTLGYYLRCLCPSLFFGVMRKKAKSDHIQLQEK